MDEVVQERKRIADTIQDLRDGVFPDLMHVNATQLEQDWLKDYGLV